MTNSISRRESHSYEDLVKSAAGGLLQKDELAGLLALDSRRAFFESCSAIERQFRDVCAGSGETCLEDGCAMDGESCLQAILKAGPEYQKACGAVWVELFRNPRNRAQGW
jgi:hypothetical protein